MRTNTALIRGRNFEPTSVSAHDDGKLVLVGDVGATNARFRLAPWPQAGAAVQWASDLLVLPTRAYNLLPETQIRYVGLLSHWPLG